MAHIIVAHFRIEILSGRHSVLRRLAWLLLPVGQWGVRSLFPAYQDRKSVV